MTVLDPGPTTEQRPIPTTNDDATNHVRVRLAASALAAAGVLFIVYPSLRPYHDETTVAGATASMSGAEDFALHAAAARHASGLIDLVNAIRNQPVALTTFGLGLTLLTVGAVFAAVAIWRARVMSRLAAVTYALAFALFIPQFYAGRRSGGARSVARWRIAGPSDQPRSIIDTPAVTAIHTASMGILLAVRRCLPDRSA